MTEMLPADAIDGKPSATAARKREDRLEKVSASIPKPARSARIEARQLALVEKLTHFADLRAARAEAALRKLGSTRAR
jgi:hypothetical protein